MCALSKNWQNDWKTTQIGIKMVFSKQEAEMLFNNSSKTTNQPIPSAQPEDA